MTSTISGIDSRNYESITIYKTPDATPEQEDILEL